MKRRLFTVLPFFGLEGLVDQLRQPTDPKPPPFLTNQILVYNEIVIPFATGKQSVFTLANVPESPTSVLLSVAGIVQCAEIDYTISNNQITFSSPPRVGSLIVAFYSYIGPNTSVLVYE